MKKIAAEQIGLTFGFCAISGLKRPGKRCGAADGETNRSAYSGGRLFQSGPAARTKGTTYTVPFVTLFSARQRRPSALWRGTARASAGQTYLGEKHRIPAGIGCFCLIPGPAAGLAGGRALSTFCVRLTVPQSGTGRLQSARGCRRRWGRRHRRSPPP